MTITCKITQCAGVPDGEVWIHDGTDVIQTYKFTPEFSNKQEEFDQRLAWVNEAYERIHIFCDNTYNLRATNTPRETGGSLTLKDMREAIEAIKGVPMTQALPVGTNVLASSDSVKDQEAKIVRVMGANPFTGEIFSEPHYIVEFARPIPEGHDGMGAGKPGHCYVVAHSDISGVEVQFVPTGLHTLQRQENYASKIRNKKENVMQRLSTLAKRTFDADTKALVEVGLLGESLQVNDPGLLLDMLVAVFKKELAEEAKLRIKEAKAENK